MKRQAKSHFGSFYVIVMIRYALKKSRYVLCIGGPGFELSIQLYPQIATTTRMYCNICSQKQMQAVTRPAMDHGMSFGNGTV